MIVPEGAVDTNANIWIGVNFFNDKFKFKDDFISVSPIVWVYIKPYNTLIYTQPSRPLRGPDHKRYNDTHNI